MKSILAALALTAAISAPSLADCYAVFAEEGREPVLLEGYDLQVEAARPGPLAALPAPEGTVGLLCDRDSVVPDSNDVKLLLNGYGLLTRSGEGEDMTILNMGIVDGNYSIAVLAGEIDEQERAAIIEAVEGFDATIDEMERWMEENPQ